MSENKKKFRIKSDEQDPKYMFLTRRTFLKGSLIAGGALTLAGCGSNQPAQQPAPAQPTPQPVEAKRISSPHYIAVDYEKCIGCRICETECALYHNNGVPDLTKSRIKVYYYNPPVDVPSICSKCNDAPCITACPDKVDALTRDEKTGAILVDDDKCIACWDCIDACNEDRTGVIRKSKDNQTVVGICDLCGGDPQCVKVCPEKCLSLVPVYMDGKYWANKPEEIAKSVARIMYRGHKGV